MLGKNLLDPKLLQFILLSISVQYHFLLHAKQIKPFLSQNERTSLILHYGQEITFSQTTKQSSQDGGQSFPWAAKSHVTGQFPLCFCSSQIKHGCYCLPRRAGRNLAFRFIFLAISCVRGWQWLKLKLLLDVQF